MKKLVRSVLLIGMSSVANTGVSVLRNKLLAVVLGPSGVGLFAQLFGVQTTVSGLVPMGLQTGALRYIALYRSEKPERLATFVATAARLFLWLSVAATIVCLVFLRPLAHWAVADPVYTVLLVAPILGVPFVVQSQTWLVFLQAGLDIGRYSRALVITSVAGLFALAPLVLVWQLKGASIHLFAFAVIGWAVAYWTAASAMGPEMRREIARAKFDREAARELWHFGSANFLPFVLTIAFPFVLRAQIVHDVGLRDNGYYQALFAISTQYLAIPLNAMTAYSFPRISQLRDVPEINREVNQAMRVAVLFSCAGILLILLARDVVVHVLYSHTFMQAVPLFPVQMVGDLVKSVSFAVQLPLLPQGRYRARNVLAVIQYGTFAAVLFAFPAQQRLWGAVWGHAISWAVHLASHLVYLNRTNRFNFTAENWRLLLTSLAAVSAVAVMPFPDPRWRVAGAAVAILWAVTSITRAEVDQVVAAVRARLGAAAGSNGGGHD